MRRFLAEYIDIVTLLTALALVAVGFVSIYSATYDARASEIFYRQLIWGAVGLVALLAALVLPFRVPASFPSPWKELARLRLPKTPDAAQMKPTRPITLAVPRSWSTRSMFLSTSSTAAGR